MYWVFKGKKIIFKYLRLKVYRQITPNKQMRVCVSLMGHGIKELWQFPCCWAALDGCHIHLKCPCGGLAACKEYHNFTNFYSIVLMGLVDAKYKFIWGSCGFPGNSLDSIILQSTQLWTDRIEGEAIPPISKDLDGTKVPPLILGDSAFPFKTWLRNLFTDAVLTSQQHYFNYRLSRARMVTECAYGQLKGRWRVCPPEIVRLVILACIVLHNICIERRDTIFRKLDVTLDPLTNNTNIIQRKVTEAWQKKYVMITKLNIFLLFYWASLRVPLNAYQETVHSNFITLQNTPSQLALSVIIFWIKNTRCFQ